LHIGIHFPICKIFGGGCEFLKKKGAGFTIEWASFSMPLAKSIDRDHPLLPSNRAMPVGCLKMK
jgi:hypothetical protein